MEIFPNGEYGYAYDETTKISTQLSETTIPSIDEISEDPQFLPEIIKKEEFEGVWIKATK
ncbi:DUF6881 domain-containing protein [Chitinivorax tropicus]|uniref:DUF6881 domain-containing protein n=1 Tax=Chitinivorax tropicus TaxID=714531 RepID=UPI003CCD90F8